MKLQIFGPLSNRENPNILSRGGQAGTNIRFNYRCVQSWTTPPLTDPGRKSRPLFANRNFNVRPELLAGLAPHITTENLEDTTLKAKVKEWVPDLGALTGSEREFLQVLDWARSYHILAEGQDLPSGEEPNFGQYVEALQTVIFFDPGAQE